MIYNSPHASAELPLTSVYDLLWSNPNKLSDESIAIIDGPSNRTFTRGEMKRQSQQLAWGLRNKLGLDAGAIVCIFSPNSFYYR